MGGGGGAVDPLAAMMAPPPRNASGRMAGGGVRSRYADPMAQMGLVSEAATGGGQGPPVSMMGGAPPMEKPKYATFAPPK